MMQRTTRATLPTQQLQLGIKYQKLKCNFNASYESECKERSVPSSLSSVGDYWWSKHERAFKLYIRASANSYYLYVINVQFSNWSQGE